MLWSFFKYYYVLIQCEKNTEITIPDLYFQGRRNPGGQGSVTPQLFDYQNFLLLIIIKRNWRIYSFKNLDSVSLAQIVFKYNKQHIA